MALAEAARRRLVRRRRPAAPRRRREEHFSPARKAHPALRVEPEGLDAIAGRLRAADVELRWDDALTGVRRFYTDDPWGNRIELLATRR